MAETANPSTPQTKPLASRPEYGKQLPAILMALVATTIVILAWTGAAPTKPWSQGYDPLGHWWLSTLCAALPVIVLLGTLAIFRGKAHHAAFLGLATAIVI